MVEILEESKAYPTRLNPDESAREFADKLADYAKMGVIFPIKSGLKSIMSKKQLTSNTICNTFIVICLYEEVNYDLYLYNIISQE